MAFTTSFLNIYSLAESDIKGVKLQEGKTLELSPKRDLLSNVSVFSIEA